MNRTLRIFHITHATRTITNLPKGGALMEYDLQTEDGKTNQVAF